MKKPPRSNGRRRRTLKLGIRRRALSVRIASYSTSRGTITGYSWGLPPNRCHPYQICRHRHGVLENRRHWQQWRWAGCSQESNATAAIGHKATFTCAIGRTFTRRLRSVTGHPIIKCECSFIGHTCRSRHRDIGPAAMTASEQIELVLSTPSAARMRLVSVRLRAGITRSPITLNCGSPPFGGPPKSAA
ncbi:hypothetical protein B0G77_0583 [Paraburkholderia sp. BL10I2N1]|nr:hypothetical protein B0G77_0583 [Paraburkholderia sp. BL10I2N1]